MLETGRLLNLHARRKKEIKARLKEFRQAYKEGDDRIFEELCFCIFTANSSARSGIKSVSALKNLNYIINGSQKQIKRVLIDAGYRYPNRAEYVVSTREFLSKEYGFKIKELIESFSSVKEARNWLAETRGIKGLGYKESTHFLRNIGKDKSIAILDRHILKNLVELEVVDELPKTLTKKRYLEIEQKMLDFSEKIKIPPNELDLVLWSKETGMVLK